MTSNPDKLSPFPVPKNIVTKLQFMFPIKKRYIREEHMRIAEWAKKEPLRPGEAGGARPETWLYNF